MSNLQEIPLADPEGLPVDGSNVATTPKSNSLKRFFKISKKPMMRDQVEDESETSSQDNKELGKSNTISRFFTRMKGSSKDGQEQSTSIAADPVDPEKPLPNIKPTIKTSISTYWKLLFNRQKSQRQNAKLGLNDNPENDSEEVHELQPVNQETETDGQPDAKEDQPEIKEERMDSEVPKASSLKPVAHKASGQDILNALEGGQLTTNSEPVDEDFIQPAPGSLNLNL
ncbi:uncharacterized protein LOC108117061 [Drosophila eugracilis]|uniref:uncharacterized protein LOC108117061 n=1 Tax=Drosophila eugracilis TaxID=29029 RepID=UPI001BD9415B|nr:uncharacterized protein LOC108117061 [Drosophila eugracilis]